MDVAEVLDRAADLIEPEGAWVQNAYGKDKHDRSVTSDMQEAVSFCAIGALARAMNVSAGEAHDWEYSLKLPGVDSLGLWNDAADRTQSEVVAKLREGAAVARAQASA